MGATISWTAAGIFGRTVVKYDDRGVRYVYIAAARPACRIMGVLGGGAAVMALRLRAWVVCAGWG